MLGPLCLDKGYDNPTGHGTVAAFQYCPHIRRIGEEKLDRWGEQTFPARRWVVERTLGWRSKCRAILVRYDKKASNYVGLILRGPHPVGLRPALVPPSAPTTVFWTLRIFGISAAWYNKPFLTFLGVIALARHHLWLTSEGFSRSLVEPDTCESPSRSVPRVSS